MHPPKAFLFAHPARHSLSPVMHNAALEALGLAARYEARDVPPADLRTVLEDLRSSGAWGCNLSIPHKEAALSLVDAVHLEAEQIGAINTVVVQGGRLEGLNTDALGFMRSLEVFGVNVAGQDVVVLGAGGAARGVCWALREAGARVAVWNRSQQRARQLAQELRLETVLSDTSLRSAIQASSGLVNTTSVGLEDANASPLPDEWLPAGGERAGPWVCDIVYRPLETRLLRAARAKGLTAIDGLGMLVFQGAIALKAWLSAQGLQGEPDVSLMRRAALNELGQAS